MAEIFRWLVAGYIAFPERNTCLCRDALAVEKCTPPALQIRDLPAVELRLEPGMKTRHRFGRKSHVTALVPANKGALLFGR